MEKSLTLYELTESMSRLHDLVDEDEGLTEYLDNVALQLNEKVDNIIKFQRNIELTVNSIDNEITRLKVLKERFQSKQDRLLDYVKYSMEKHDIEKINTGLFVLSLRKSTAVIIEDESLIPAEFINVKTTTSIDKMSIAKRLKIDTVPGAKLETRKNLQIK